PLPFRRSAALVVFLVWSPFSMRTDHEVEESRTLSVARRARTLHQSRSVEEESEEALLSLGRQRSSDGGETWLILPVAYACLKD
ncbi:hypothetical protein TNCV_2698971, partial [Trichonephila clavipes]